MSSINKQGVGVLIKGGEYDKNKYININKNCFSCFKHLENVL